MYREKPITAGLDARIKQTSTPLSILPRLTGNYISAVGGLVLAVMILIPVTWLPGLLILVLPTEVYLIDFVSSRLSSQSELKNTDISKKERSNFSSANTQKPMSSWGAFSHFKR